MAQTQLSMPFLLVGSFCLLGPVVCGGTRWICSVTIPEAVGLLFRGLLCWFSIGSPLFRSLSPVPYLPAFLWEHSAGRRAPLSRVPLLSTAPQAEGTEPVLAISVPPRSMCQAMSTGGMSEQEGGRTGSGR